MKVTIDTTALKDMVSKAEKGAGNNKLLPITNLIGVRYFDNVFTLFTTDGTNTLRVSKELEAVDGSIDVAVAVDRFAKLITRMTSSQITLEVVDNYLQVTGNGTYKIELPYDENGNVVTYKDPATKLINHTCVEDGAVSSSVIKQIINSVKSALSVTPDVPCYMNYYVADKVIGTDTYTIADLESSVFNTPKLISAELMNLIGLTNDSQLSYSIYDDGNIVFTASDCSVYGRCSDGLDEYAIAAINKLLDMELTSKCEIAKDSILQLLDRLMLFVAPYDKNAVRLTFAKDALYVESLNASGAERIEYLTMSEDVHEATYTIDVQILQTQLKASLGNNVEIYWGSDSAIKLKSGNLSQIIALMQE